ncbi:MAG: transcription termination/antitermination NusG family protein [Flavobacteriales bacterium]
MSEIDKKWYVVRAIGGQENKAKDFLESEISAAGLSDYVGQILIPTEKVLQIRNGKKVTKERNHFPGYVFVECALVGEVPHVIRNTPNVIGFLGAEKRGDPLPLRAVEWQLFAVHGKEVLPEEFPKLRKQRPETSDHRIVPPDRIMGLRAVNDEQNQSDRDQNPDHHDESYHQRI